MNDAPYDNDDALLDRLVDGELPPDELRRLLASLDGQSDGWRRCALAFLEAQSWRGAMRAMLQAAPSATPAAALTPSTESTSAHRRRFARIDQLFAAAAALLAAFGLGWQLSGKGPGQDGGHDLVASVPRVDGVDALSPQQRRRPDPDSVTLVVQNREGEPQRLEVPLVEGSRLGEHFLDAPQWAAPEVRQRLSEQGIDLRARRRYAPLFFEQQDRIVPLIVPVDDAIVTPVSRPVY
jgi:hypothetical protein